MKVFLKKLLDKLLLLVTALAIMGIIVGIIWYFITADLREIERQNKVDPAYKKIIAEAAKKEKAEKEKLKELDKKKKAEEKAKTSFEKSIKGKYTKDYLSQIISSDRKMSEGLFIVGNKKCMKYWFASHDWDDDLCYDELSYYVFKNESCAKKALNTMKETWIDRETDSGENYVQGWQSNVLDAQVEMFIYQIDNMIITTDLQVVSEWSEPETGEEDNSVVGFFYRKDFIIGTFPL